MSDARIEAYSRALFEVAQAEGNLQIVEDELFRMARAIEANEKLRSTLTDASIPAARRQQVVEELLGGKASNTSVQLVSLLVGAGRGRELVQLLIVLYSVHQVSNNAKSPKCEVRLRCLMIRQNAWLRH